MASLAAFHAAKSARTVAITSRSTEISCSSAAPWLACAWRICALGNPP
jgi:hypothetical protein